MIEWFTPNIFKGKQSSLSSLESVTGHAGRSHIYSTHWHRNKQTKTIIQNNTNKTSLFHVLIQKKTNKTKLFHALTQKKTNKTNQNKTNKTSLFHALTQTKQKTFKTKQTNLFHAFTQKWTNKTNQNKTNKIIPRIESKGNKQTRNTITNATHKLQYLFWFIYCNERFLDEIH